MRGGRRRSGSWTAPPSSADAKNRSPRFPRQRRGNGPSASDEVAFRRSPGPDDGHSCKCGMVLCLPASTGKAVPGRRCLGLATTRSWCCMSARDIARPSTSRDRPEFARSPMRTSPLLLSSHLGSRGSHPDSTLAAMNDRSRTPPVADSGARPVRTPLRCLGSEEATGRRRPGRHRSTPRPGRHALLLSMQGDRGTAERGRRAASAAYLLTSFLAISGKISPTVPPSDAQALEKSL